MPVKVSVPEETVIEPVPPKLALTVPPVEVYEVPVSVPSWIVPPPIITAPTTWPVAPRSKMPVPLTASGPVVEPRVPPDRTYNVPAATMLPPVSFDSRKRQHTGAADHERAGAAHGSGESGRGTAADGQSLRFQVHDAAGHAGQRADRLVGGAQIERCAAAGDVHGPGSGEDVACRREPFVVEVSLDGLLLGGRQRAAVDQHFADRSIEIARALPRIDKVAS